MTELSIFLHIGNVNLWHEISEYLDRVKNIDFSLYVNFSKSLVSDIDYIKYKNIISEKYANTIFFNFENKGCDIGPFFKFLQYSRDNSIKHEWIIKIHTKSDKQWRSKLLNDLFPLNFKECFEDLKKSGRKISGSYIYPYDYVNMKYDISNLKLVNFDIITDWRKYENEYPETKNMNVIEKNFYLKQNREKSRYLPLIDLELYEYLFGDYKKDHALINAMNKWAIIKEIKSGTEFLHYYPGTFLILNYQTIEKIFKNVSFDDIFDSLEENKLDDTVIQSNTHSWERILPVLFSLENLKI